MVIDKCDTRYLLNNMVSECGDPNVEGAKSYVFVIFGCPPLFIDNGHASTLVLFSRVSENISKPPHINSNTAPAMRYVWRSRYIVLWFRTAILLRCTVKFNFATQCQHRNALVFCTSFRTAECLSYVISHSITSLYVISRYSPKCGTS